jgi:hypothetical protein
MIPLSQPNNAGPATDSVMTTVMTPIARLLRQRSPVTDDEESHVK